ncbi:3-oxoadipate enol-lactonase [Breoghania sp. L-A4]|uniref:3-oxoadipate enol-lactonase n=1 Tax=Breoghania sp. L-A4 TaxID=2304600 RepID=UPI000E35C5C8|nr:3-oxoadipate enol-lactonase [Breoghania sp. L-A4]AXS41137.1 3-oxoadipate enol-lactonase [Breoghania sp. L-A4]
MPTITMDDGTRIHYEFEGAADKPVLLFSNSLATDLHMWDDQMLAFSADHRILRYDSRGHGQSDAPKGPYSIEILGRDVLALLDALGLDTVDYCGLSKGGMVGMWLGTNAPQRFRKMVYSNTSAHMPTKQMWADRAAKVRADGVASIGQQIVDRWFTPEFQKTAPERVAKVAAMIDATPGEGYAACCEAIAEMDQSDSIRTISLPVMVIAGADDPSTPPDHAERIAGVIKGAKLVVLPKAAHLSNIEQTELFNAALKDFLDA